MSSSEGEEGKSDAGALTVKPKRLKKHGKVKRFVAPVSVLLDDIGQKYRALEEENARLRDRVAELEKELASNDGDKLASKDGVLREEDARLRDRVAKLEKELASKEDDKLASREGDKFWSYDEARKYLAPLGLIAGDWVVYSSMPTFRAWKSGKKDKGQYEGVKKIAAQIDELKKKMAMEQDDEAKKALKKKIKGKRDRLRKLQIAIPKVEKIWAKHGARPIKIAASPFTFYKGKGWQPTVKSNPDTGWCHFLSYARKGEGLIGTRTLSAEDAKPFLRSLKFKIFDDYKDWASWVKYAEWESLEKPDEHKDFADNVIRAWKEHGKRPDNIRADLNAYCSKELRKKGIRNAAAYLLGFGEYAEDEGGAAEEAKQAVEEAKGPADPVIRLGDAL
jgi:hypothetical protein